MISLRLSEQEYRELQAAASGAGVSAFVRSAIRVALKAERASIRAAQKAERQLWWSDLSEPRVQITAEPAD
jgi:hypothetical protein